MQFLQLELCLAHLNLIQIRIILRQAMAGTREELEELRDGIEEIDDLWNEKEKQRLAEVTQNGHHGKRHAGKVAEGVTDKHSWWIPIVTKQGGRSADVRKEKVEGEDARFAICSWTTETISQVTCKRQIQVMFKYQLIQSFSTWKTSWIQSSTI